MSGISEPFETFLTLPARCFNDTSFANVVVGRAESFAGMAIERRILTPGLVVWMAVPTGLLLLDRYLFHLRGGEALGYLALWLLASAASGIVQLVATVRALLQGRIILWLTLFLAVFASVMVVPLILIYAWNPTRNFWSPVF
jgi:hypothetical protein